MDTKESYDIIIPITFPFKKTYNVIRKKFNGESYRGDVSGIANWFYNAIDNRPDNITITIDGNFHTTFPNPPHLTTEITYDGNSSGRLHMSLDQNGYWYQQILPSGGKRKSNARTRNARTRNARTRNARTRK